MSTPPPMESEVIALIPSGTSSCFCHAQMTDCLKSYGSCGRCTLEIEWATKVVLNIFRMVEVNVSLT